MVARFTFDSSGIERKNKTTGNPPIAEAPLTNPENNPREISEYQLAEILNLTFFQINKLEVSTITDIVSPIIS